MEYENVLFNCNFRKYENVFPSVSFFVKKKYEMSKLPLNKKRNDKIIEILIAEKHGIQYIIIKNN